MVVSVEGGLVWIFEFVGFALTLTVWSRLEKYADSACLQEPSRLRKFTPLDVETSRNTFKSNKEYEDRERIRRLPDRVARVIQRI